MAYVRIETSVPSHRKFVEAGPLASWLWVCGLCYAQEGLTDGHIPAKVVPRLCQSSHPERLAKRLVLVGLWDEIPGKGYAIHDYHTYNHSREYVQEIQEKRRMAGKIRQHSAQQSAKHSAQQITSIVLNPHQQSAQRVLDPETETETEDQSTEKAARARETQAPKKPRRPPDDPTRAQLIRLAHTVVEDGAVDPADQPEELKTRAARARFAYEPQTIGEALDIARRQRTAVS